MQKFASVVQSKTGRAVAGASVLVLTAVGTPATIYAADAGAVKDNPILTDDAGRFSFYAADGRYSLQISFAGVVQYTLTDILLEDPANDPAVQADELAASGGAALVGYLPAGTGASARTAQDKLRESVSVMDFGARGDGTDDTAAIQAAIDYVQSTYVHGTSDSDSNGSCRLFFPAGYYAVSDRLIVSAKIAIEGEGQTEFSSGSRLVQTAADKDIFALDTTNGSFSFSVEKLVMKSTVAGAGHLINTKYAGTTYNVNSQRYINCTFSNPQQQSLMLVGDDILVDGCLFDVSGYSGMAIQLGTSTAGPTGRASNVRIAASNFFNCPVRGVLILNAYGVVIDGNQVTQPGGGGSSTTAFVDAADGAPSMATRISISGNTLEYVQRLFEGAGVSDVTITGNVGSQMGGGAGSIYHCIKTNAASSNIVITGNGLSGDCGTKNFLNALGTTGVTATGNSFHATGGTGACIDVTGVTVGTLAPNTYRGFGVNVVADDYLRIGIQPTAWLTAVYGPSITPDARTSAALIVSVTNGSACTVNAPLNPSVGQEFEFTIRNVSGGVIALSWAAIYKMAAWVQPSTNSSRSIRFRYDGNDWVEMSRTPGDVPLS